MGRLIVFLMSFFVALIVSLGVAAQTEDLSNNIHHEFVSVRAQGMGGAIAAAADDQTAIFFNPAALARRKVWKINAFFQAGLDQDFLDVYGGLKDADDLSGDDKTNKIIDEISNNFGKEPHVRLTAPSLFWLWEGWGFAFVPADVTVNLGLDQQIGPSINVTSYVDTTFALSTGRKIRASWAKAMSWGATVKAVHRGFYQDSVTAAQFAQDDDLFNADDADEGLTVDVDLGFLFTPRLPTEGFFSLFRAFRPTFALVGRNLIDYGFTTDFDLISDQTGEPPKLQRRFDVGTKWELPKFWIFKPRFVFDIRDMGHDNWTFIKGQHAGFELDWIAAQWLKGAYRVGLNQGYASAGVTLQFTLFKLDVATWGEEIGTKDNRTENRRWLVNASLDF